MAMQQPLSNEVYVCPTSIPHQCAWCAAVADGVYEGELFFLEVEGTLQPDRLQEYSHILCIHCLARQRGLWERRKARKKQCDDSLEFIEKGDLLCGN